MQLEKTKVRLELLLLEKGYSLKVEAYVIFVNPEFTLLGAPSDAKFILPSQILGHLRNVQAPAQLNAEQIKLAEMLEEFKLEPDYYDLRFDQLEPLDRSDEPHAELRRSEAAAMSAYQC